MNLPCKILERAVWLAILAAGTAATPWSLAGRADSEELGDPRGVVVEEVRNDRPSFMVRVDVDHPDRTYRGGEEMRVRVVSEKAGYLYLLYCDADKNITCLFPNSIHQENYIPAGRPIEVPQPGSRFRLRIAPPYGQEVLKAIVSLAPLDRDQVKALVHDDPEVSVLGGVKAAYGQMKSQPAGWAEHYVSTMTMSPEGGAPAPGGPENPPPQNPASTPRRVGVFLGINDFQDPQIRDLKVGENDAVTMAEVMKRKCGLQEAIVLVGEQATLKNIEDAVRKRLPAVTRPGDTVVLYWSGHGARCADDNGDESDGFDEYLVPYDGRFADLATIRQTMLLDDTFGRWFQELDGRQLLVILDTCHSGGQSAQEKSLAKGLGNEEPAAGAEFDFLDGELARAKDIGQEETALLASSMANQVSFERKEGDLSTMTYFLVEQLNLGSESVTLLAAYESMKQRVAEYVEQMFPGTTQTPVLVDNLSPPFFLRP